MNPHYIKNSSRFLLLTGLFTLAGIIGLVVPAAQASETPFERLANGNKRFVSGETTSLHRDTLRMLETARDGQKPFCTVLTCADSRVPVEILFDQGIGDTFVTRVAGNVADTDEIGTIEYGVDHLKTPLLVVLGHSSCGAVSAVVEGADVHGHIPRLVDNIVPAVDLTRALYPGLDDKEIIPLAITQNVWQSIKDILKRSPVVRERVKEGHLQIIGAVYHLDTGEVEWLGPHRDEAKLLNSTTED